MKANRRQYYNSQLRALEWEVKLYHDTKAELREAKDEIILARAQYDEGMPRGSAVGDQTAHRAMALLSSHAIREMERRITAIDRAMGEWCARDTAPRMMFIRLRFWDNTLTNEGIAQRLNIAAVTTGMWRRNFLSLVGRYLGWRV